jgi:hypothetical protein
MSPYNNSGANKSLEHVRSPTISATVTDRNLIHEEDETDCISWNLTNLQIQNLLFSRLVSKDLTPKGTKL